jgi:hypothetical protein
MSGNVGWSLVGRDRIVVDEPTAAAYFRDPAVRREVVADAGTLARTLGRDFYIQFDGVGIIERVRVESTHDDDEPGITR